MSTEDPSLDEFTLPEILLSHDGYYSDEDDEDFWADCFSDLDSEEIPEDIPEHPSFVRSVHSLPHLSFTTNYTNALLRNLDDNSTATHVYETVMYMKGRGINLPIFMDAVFWGNSLCSANADVRSERTAFMSSEFLPVVLERMWNPPGGRAGSGHDALKRFAVQCTQEVLTTEMNAIASKMKPPDDPLSLANLTSINFSEFGNYLRTEGCPTLWFLLLSLAWSARQAKENSTKSPFHVIMMIIVMLSYTRSHHRSAITIIWSIYLKACGVPARAFDALHALGITMSHKWTANALGTMSANAMKQMREAIQQFPWAISHDNINFPLRVFSQRLHNQTHFISACAGTIWIFPKHASLPDDANRKYQEKRREGSKAPFDIKEFLTGSNAVQARRHVRTQAVYRILQFLLDCPVFKSYRHRNDPILASPPPVDLLPCGKDHIVHQHILETVKEDESTYDGTDNLVNAIYPRQMDLSSFAEKVFTGLKRVIAWIGDQMTAERMRGLAKFRFNEPNSYLRMDWIIILFGWFHLIMAFANSLHTQYLGTTSGMGLRKAFNKLGRKHLLKQETKGVFWHNLDEALWHVGEANFLACWCVEGGTDNLLELLKKSPQELKDMAEQIYNKYASRKAYEAINRKPLTEQDQVLKQSILFGADILPYFDLREAIEIGDVGRMENLLSTLLLRFAGGKNPKYTIELLELIQCLLKEWTDEIKNLVRRFCWLINRIGKRHSFTPIDQAQEQNNKDIKVTHRSFGPGATFEYIKKISPAIPMLRAIKEAVRSQFPILLARGKHHGKPSKDADVEMLRKMYLEERSHEYISGRTFRNAEDCPKDYIEQGAQELTSKNGPIDRWWNERNFKRSTEEVWEDDTQESN